MDAVNLAEAKAHLSELIDRVGGGDSIEITRRGKPVARLTAAPPPAQADRRDRAPIPDGDYARPTRERRRSGAIDARY